MNWTQEASDCSQLPAVVGRTLFVLQNQSHVHSSGTRPTVCVVSCTDVGATDPYPQGFRLCVLLFRPSLSLAGSFPLAYVVTDTSKPHTLPQSPRSLCSCRHTCLSSSFSPHRSRLSPVCSGRAESRLRLVLARPVCFSQPSAQREAE